jgi:hypothetical protein
VWVAMGAVVLTLTIEFCYFMEALAIGSDVVLSWGATGRSIGLLVAGGVIAFALVTSATIIILHVPSPIVRFVGGAMYACAALVVQLCNDSATAATVTAIRHVRGDWDAESVALGVTVVCAVVCFVLLGANVSRLKVSRHSLDDLLHAMKREMNRMQSDLAVQMEIATDERKERAVVRALTPVRCCLFDAAASPDLLCAPSCCAALQLGRWIEMMQTCRPHMPTVGMAMAMAPVVGWSARPTAEAIAAGQAALQAAAAQRGRTTPNGSVRTGMAGAGGTDGKEQKEGGGPLPPGHGAPVAVPNPFEEKTPATSSTPQAQLDEASVQLALMQIDGGQSALSAGGIVPPDTTLNAVLAHPFCFALFQDHLHAAKQADSLVCWAVMRRFSLLTGPTIRAAVAASVYDNFIRAGAPFEINISHSLVRTGWSALLCSAVALSLSRLCSCSMPPLIVHSPPLWLLCSAT